MDEQPISYAGAAHRQTEALERIADAIEDYLRLTLSAQKATQALQSAEPEVAAVLQPIADVIADIKARRGW